MTSGNRSKNRSAETIIADWLLGFVGGTDDLEKQRPNARTILRWLRDEGWEITRIRTARPEVSDPGPAGH